MKYLATFSLIFLILSSILGHLSFADEYLRDVPEGHWANDAVYALVKMGVTKGYPDGTFRGQKYLTRFEIASFLSKLARSFDLTGGIDEKLIEELKSETSLIKYQREKETKETRVAGEFLARARGSTFPTHSGALDYRLKLSLTRNFDDSSFKVNLDTVDTGFNLGSTRSLTTKLLDIEGKFKLWGLDFKACAGPGTITHTDKFFYSDNYMIYIRPKTSLTASTDMEKLSLSASYVTRCVATSGLIGVHELTGVAKYKYGDLALFVQPRYVYKIDGPRDILADFGVNYIFPANCLTQLFLSIGDFQAQTSGMYLKVTEKITDPWQKGTTITLRFDKIGSQYRVDNLDKYEFVYLNNFDRLVLDGTVDLGLKIEQKIGDRLAVEGMSDYVLTGDYKYGADYPGTYWLWQLAMSYNVYANATALLFYKSYNVPSGLAQFSDPVPAVSEIIGLGLKYAF